MWLAGGNDATKVIYAVPCICAIHKDWVMLPLVAINIGWVLLWFYRLPRTHLWYCIGCFAKVILILLIVSFVAV